MIKSRKVHKIIDGVKFTFECVRSSHINFNDKIIYRRKWFWGADVFSCKNVAIGGKSSIYSGIKYQVKAAQMELCK